MSETLTAERAGAPWHLWVIGGLGLIWSAIGALDYYMTQTRNEAYMGGFTPEQLEYFYGLPAWVVSTWAIAVWGGVLGALLLLLRRRLAVLVLLASLLGTVATAIHNFLLSNGLEVMGGAFALVFSALIFLIALALYIYARALQARGVLA